MVAQTIERTKGLTEVPLSKVRPNPWNPRTNPETEGFDELVESVRLDGILQPPVAREKDGTYQLAFGHRRLAAAKVVHQEDPTRDTIPVIVREISDEQMAVWGIDENDKRKDITPIEKARAVVRYLRTFEKTQTETGKRLGLDQASVANMIRVLRLPKGVLDAVDAGEISFSGAKVFTCLLNDGCDHERTMLATIKSAGRYAGDREGPFTVRVLSDELARVAIQAISNKPSMFTLSTRRYDHPTFDIKKFEKEYPSKIHTLPGGEKATCAMKEWKTWEGIAKNEAKKKDAGKKEVRMADLLKKAKPATKILASEKAPEIRVRYEWDTDPGDGQYKYVSATIPFTTAELLPDPNRPAPVAGADAGTVPDVDQAAHKKIATVGLAKASAEVLKAAMGTRNKVLGEIDHSIYNSYVVLDNDSLERVKAPEECTKSCTWGMCFKKVPTEGDNTLLQRLCTNMKCFETKRKMHTKDLEVRGKAGIVAEDKKIDDVIADIIAKGSFAISKPVARMVLDSLYNAGSFGGRGAWTSTDEWLSVYFKVTGTKGDIDTKEALQKRMDSLLVEELRVLILHMSLARLRGSSRPVDWTPELEGHLAAMKKVKAVN